MADVCSWCGAADMAPLLDTAECLDCGRHSKDGQRVLPGSLQVEPNSDHNLAQYGPLSAPVEAPVVEVVAEAPPVEVVAEAPPVEVGEQPQHDQVTPPDVPEEAPQ